MKTFTNESANFKVSLDDWLNSSSDGEHLSSVLCDTLPDLILRGTPRDRLAQIVTYIKLIDLIEDLGWIEHTANWDLGLLIKLNSGLEVDAGHGYCIMEIPGVITFDTEHKVFTSPEIPDDYDNLMITVEIDSATEENKSDTDTTHIPLKEIKSISLYR